MKVRSIVAGLAAMVCMGLFSPAATASSTSEAGFREEILRQINAFRVAEHREPVAFNDDLNSLASQWAEKLAREGAMRHRNLGNLKEIIAVHGWRTMNENLFMSSSSSATPSETMAAWKGSYGHRTNLLKANISHIGIGTASGSHGFFVVFNGAGG